MDSGYSRKDEDTGVVAYCLLLQKGIHKEQDSLLLSAVCEIDGIFFKKSEGE